jgi:hypothetical protein
MSAPWLVESLGWAATAVFVGSYFFGRAERIVQVQMVGALIWAAYGVALHALPVVVANVLVLAAAGWKAWHTARAASPPAPKPAPEGEGSR